jgi:hypothetical protein
MAVKEYGGQGFCQVISHVNRSIDAIKKEEVALDSLAESKIFDIDMARSRHGFLRISHCGAAVIIFVEECCCFLWDVKIPEYAPNKKNHLSSVARCHKLGFR